MKLRRDVDAVVEAAVRAGHARTARVDRLMDLRLAMASGKSSTAEFLNYCLISQMMFMESPDVSPNSRDGNRGSVHGDLSGPDAAAHDTRPDLREGPSGRLRGGCIRHTGMELELCLACGDRPDDLESCLRLQSSLTA